MNVAMKKYNNHNGFTLIELSVVLVIIGLLVSLGSSMVGPMTTYVKVRETRDIQDAAVQSIISRASSRNSIPDSSATADIGFSTVVRSTKDAWNQDVAYLYDANFSPATPTKDTICGRRSTLLKLDTGSGVMNNVAFMIISRADNKTDVFKSVRDVGGVINGVSSGISVATTVTANGTNPDIIRWVTLDELRSKIGCQGAPLKIVNNELPFGAVPNPYTVTLTADGGTGAATFKWCVSTLPTNFSQTGGIQNANCLGLNETNWNPASANLVISFPAGAVTTGAHLITVVVRDNADGTAASNACDNANPGDNCAQKQFVLTVNPQ
jgi:prepilin-type N-terminal cleavage/methylation domain-containing protein